MEPTMTPYPVQPTPARPQFLTILCILTFLSCALGLYNSIMTIATADTAASITQEVLSEASDKIQEKDSAGFVDKILGSVSKGLTADNLRRLGISQLVYNLFTLIGAILMFRLRKMGFYAYVSGVALGFILPIILVGGIIGVGSSAGVFFSVVFAILYGLNLKYMTN